MNNENKQTPPKGKKGLSVGLVICFVAVVAMVGTYTFQHYNSGVRDELAKQDQAEEQNKAEDSKSANTSTVLPEKEEPAKTEESQTTDKNDAKINTADTAANTTAAPAANAEVSFSEADQLLWPMEGNVLMSFSMDKTVYFSTLDQYKYNPAMILGGEVGQQVTASARGIVKSVEETAKTGLTMTLDIGGGYELVYGQLKDAQFHEGNLVEAGDFIGYLNQPTKYYTLEGCSLYFELLKDGTPVDPMNFLEV